MAINTEGVLGWELYEKGGIDTDRLVDFLEKFITTKFKNKLIIFTAFCEKAVKILYNYKNRRFKCPKV